ncbi:hypothetical protein FN846DRAFT_200119 [Sphaerosporella brunnea]|uniref:Fe2OG dioxygenase domain-containing protein n=1 Tax=Sphaerosporella brunnea TaxID=1250544 RepID=A0A5J5EN73_9PEZI|nr:hypothetical protein FN846DRAFT_200119 [Sphaerosporella brunnea]
MAATTIQTPAPIRGVRITPMGKPTFQLPPQRPQTPTSYFKSPFDPSRHLAYNAMPSRHTMSEIGYENTGVSQIAVSEPFELFTPEAVRTMRNEVLSDEVWDNCRFASSIAACQLRGMAPKYAKFVYDAWMNPETLRIISGVAGVELVPVMEYEIGHINISVNDDPDGKTQAAPVVGWHKDSYPFVCVLMLSDATEMKGGETALRTGSGDIMKVRGPQMGSAVVLQGKYIDHIALPSTNARERITMVTSFRPKDPMITDDSHLVTVRPISDLNEMYNQWTDYRVEIAQERCHNLIKKLRENKRVGRDFDVIGVKDKLSDLIKLLTKTRDEIVDPAEYKIEDIEEEREQEKESQRTKKRARLS